MKKFLILLICSILTFSSFGVCNLKNTSAIASEEYENYLISPTAIAVSENKLFVFDEWENELILYNLSSKERVASVTLSGVSKLLISGNKLYALRLLNENEMEISIFSLNLESSGSLNFQPENFYIDFVILGTELKALKEDGDIDYFTISGNTLSYQYTRKTSAISFEGLKTRKIIGMSYVNNKITITFSEGIYSYNTETSEIKKIYSAPIESEITHSTKGYVRLSNKDVVKISTGKTIVASNTDCSAIAVYNEKVYLSNKNSHQVFMVVENTISDIGLNPDITPTIFKADNFKHLKLKSSEDLKLKPYSVNKTRRVESGKHLTAIGELGNYYYCLYVGETNEFLYLEKSTNYEVIDIGLSPSNYIVTVPTQIHQLPSSLANNNAIMAEVSASENVIVTNSTIIKNNKDELFYLVSIDNEFGFIKYSAVQSTRGNYELTTPCNAKIKRATTLFVNSDGTEEIIKLEKGTRIATQEETGPTKDYIKIEYQDPNGIIFSGYVLADDIDPDGLSTLQILGLILVGTNLALLLTIVIIKRNSKKWKV